MGPDLKTHVSEIFAAVFPHFNKRAMVDLSELIKDVLNMPEYTCIRFPLSNQ